MTARTGELLTPPTITHGIQEGTGDIRLAGLPGSGVNPIPHYALAAYDTNSIRYHWIDTSVSLTNAPTPAGGATYVSASLVVMGKF